MTIPCAVGCDATYTEDWLTYSSSTDEAESQLFSPQHSAESAASEVGEVLHRSPVLYGLDRHSWTHQALGHTIDWMRTLSLPAICKLLQRFKLVYKRGRAHVHSPDLEYNQKMAAIVAAREAAQQAPGEVVFLYEDEFTAYLRPLVDAARAHLDETSGHDHGDNSVEGRTLWEKLRNPKTPVLVAQNVAMDWSMLWKDLIAGFVIAGAISALVPGGVWKALFLNGHPAWIQLPLNATVGPLIAVISFVCSIGNVPMAAVLWGSGISFGGALSFLYADLIVLPLLDVYRRYYGWQMAAYIGALFFVTMVGAGIIMDLVFRGFHQIPLPNPHMRVEMMLFSFNYTFWLNVIFAAIALFMWCLAAKHPMAHGCHEHAAPARAHC